MQINMFMFMFSSFRMDIKSTSLKGSLKAHLATKMNYFDQPCAKGSNPLWEPSCSLRAGSCGTFTAGFCRETLRRIL